MFGIYDMLKWQGKNLPNKTALICGEDRYTYQQINDRINCVSYELAQLGVKKGTQVGLVLHNGIDFVSAFYAVVKLGGCANLFDYRWKKDELREHIDAVGCEYFIVENEYNNPAQQAVAITTRNSEYPNLEAFYKNGKEDWEDAASIAEDDVIYTVFTGGTTGITKAAMHTQQSAFMRVVGVVSNCDDTNRHDVYLNYGPMFHIGGLSSMINVFGAGGTFCLLATFSVDNIIDTIVKEHVTQMLLVPPTIIDRMYAQKQEFDVDLSSIRILLLAGGAATEGTIERAFELMPDVKCRCSYGASECALLLSNTFGKEEFYADKTIARSLGTPQLFYECKVVREDGSDADVNESGEVYARGLARMAGFRNRDNPFTEDGWYPTGDIMRKDEHGVYHFVSRCKDMIKSGGENVYATEVETAIMKDNVDKIVECAVTGLPSEDWGEIVVAAVVLKDGVTMTEQEIIEHCKQHIASFKKPKKVFFLDVLPRSTAGKVKKGELKEILAAMA